MSIWEGMRGSFVLALRPQPAAVTISLLRLPVRSCPRPRFFSRFRAFLWQNPDYYEDPQPSNMSPITGLAVEIWTVDGVR